jgi:hypothetical protein
MVMSAAGPQGSFGTSDGVSALIEDLQYQFGEGPCVDAYHQDRPIGEPDLAGAVTTRWLAFTAPAVHAGARAVFGFPLRMGAARLGALDLYCDRPGPLSDDQYADALAMAEVTASAVLMLQAGAPPGALAAALESGADLLFVVHQAAGMVSVQLDVSVGEALVRLRSFAFVNDRSLDDIARDVVARRLRFDH